MAQIPPTHIPVQDEDDDEPPIPPPPQLPLPSELVRAPRNWTGPPRQIRSQAHRQPVAPTEPLRVQQLVGCCPPLLLPVCSAMERLAGVPRMYV